MRAFAAVAVAAAALTPALPPAPSTWPPYPRFPASSCWTRSAPGGMLRSAPSYRGAPAHLSPKTIVRRVLAQLGDRRFVQRVELGHVPPITQQHSGWFGTSQPPRDALWAYVAAPEASVRFGAKPNPAAVQRSSVAEWEAELVFGALRDAFCANGGPPLVGWTMSGIRGVSDSSQALGQRFPAPSGHVFRVRLAAVAHRYGFTVVSVRLLRAPQLTPLVVVRTSRAAKSFVPDVAKIMELLDPRRGSAVTFEGFYFEALDAHGPFVSVDDVYRGEIMGGQWSSNPCLYPYAHSTPFNQHC